MANQTEADVVQAAKERFAYYGFATSPLTDCEIAQLSGDYSDNEVFCIGSDVAAGFTLAESIAAMESDAWSNQTELVTGDLLAAGDIVRNHGYRWKITKVTRDVHLGMDRWYVHARALGAPDLPRCYRENMEMGLRCDLTWIREIIEAK